jgi:hypothetical protein
MARHAFGIARQERHSGSARMPPSSHTAWSLLRIRMTSFMSFPGCGPRRRRPAIVARSWLLRAFGAVGAAVVAAILLSGRGSLTLVGSSSGVNLRSESDREQLSQLKFTTGAAAEKLAEHVEVRVGATGSTIEVRVDSDSSSGDSASESDPNQQMESASADENNKDAADRVQAPASVSDTATPPTPDAGSGNASSDISDTISDASDASTSAPVRARSKDYLVKLHMYISL